MTDVNPAQIPVAISEVLRADTLSDMSTGKLRPIPPLVPSPKLPNGSQKTATNSEVTAVSTKTTASADAPKESGVNTSESSNPLSLTTWRFFEIAVAEIIGTACLMFFGCMGLLGTDVPKYQGPVSFGLTVCSIIVIFGHISAAHLNPAVTVIAVVLGKITPLTGIVYFISENIGAILGFGVLKYVTPCDIWLASSKNETGVCSTVPLESLTDIQSLLLEFFATMFLSFVVCGVWDSRNVTNVDAVPLKFAGVVTVMSITVGPFTGASMNPARTLAPAIINGVWTSHWVYWVGPLGAAFVTSVFYQIAFDKKQQLKPEIAEEVPLTGVTTVNSKNMRLPNVTSDVKKSLECQPK